MIKKQVLYINILFIRKIKKFIILKIKIIMMKFFEYPESNDHIKKYNFVNNIQIYIIKMNYINSALLYLLFLPDFY